MAATKVAKCDCNSDFQDKRYGKGLRLFNLNQGKERGTCTVCGKQKVLK